MTISESKAAQAAPSIIQSVSEALKQDCGRIKCCLILLQNPPTVVSVRMAPMARMRADNRVTGILTPRLSQLE